MTNLRVESQALAERLEKIHQSLEEIQAKCIIKRASVNQVAASKALVALVLSQQADTILRRAEQTIVYCTTSDNYERDLEEKLDTPVFNALNLLKSDLGLETFNDKPAWLSITKNLVQALDSMVSQCYRELEAIAQLNA